MTWSRHPTHWDWYFGTYSLRFRGRRRPAETQRVAWLASRLRKAAMRPCDCCKGRREREREQRRRETGTSAIFGFELEPLLIMMKSNLVQDAIFFWYVDFVALAINFIHSYPPDETHIFGLFATWHGEIEAAHATSFRAVIQPTILDFSNVRLRVNRVAGELTLNCADVPEYSNGQIQSLLISKYERSRASTARVM